MTLQPLFVMDLLSGLGFGEQVMVSAVFVLTVLYLLKGKKAAGTFVGVMGTMWLLTVGILAAAAVAIFLGWVNPVPEEFMADIVKAAKATFDFVKGPVDDWIRDLIRRAMG